MVIDCRCELFEKILGCLYIISICASDLLVSYRVYALYINRTGVVVFLAILKVAVLAGCITVLLAEDVPTTLPTCTNHCVHGRPASYAFLSAAIPLLSDTLIFLLIFFFYLYEPRVTVPNRFSVALACHLCQRCCCAMPKYILCKQL